ncbi:hypothetical protein [Aureimonas phyllosphaerae]|uniref:Uncharacterized protein n=1 Tax=Aureimonas phyllosphaerae TaxID=1166078 RepID=A0A7W6BXQ9_9HYPH|nr:hypothetical protein [Aureimonas phyllosphaerae]MBB3938019.1 hypothetical protein [Aureimonas phyllosphaerae]MBB3962026.1 hypothetical protein [Aureimonas phyllosphaerae]
MALLVPGGAVAQDAAAPPVAPPQAGAPAMNSEQVPAGSAEDAAQSTAGSPTASQAGPAGWEGEVPPAYAGTRTPVGANAIEAWLAQPRSILDDNPRGGRNMAQFVRSLVESDNRSVLTLVDLVKMPDVRDAQVGAVAEGLASAMRDSEGLAPRYAAYIQWAVAQSGSNELIEAFERSSGADEDRTAAIGGGAGGGGAAGGGSLGGGGAPGTSGPAGDDSTVAQTGGLTGGRGGGGSVSLSESDRLLDGASGRLILCTVDASPAGCQVVF